MRRGLRNVAVYFGLAESEEPDPQPLSGTELAWMTGTIFVTILIARIVAEALGIESFLAQLGVALAVGLVAGTALGAARRRWDRKRSGRPPDPSAGS